MNVARAKVLHYYISISKNKQLTVAEGRPRDGRSCPEHIHSRHGCVVCIKRDDDALEARGVGKFKKKWEDLKACSFCSVRGACCLIRLSTATTNDSPHCSNRPHQTTDISLSAMVLIFDEFSENIIQERFTCLLLNRSQRAELLKVTRSSLRESRTPIPSPSIS
jgi:hypothetical protein